MTKNITARYQHAVRNAPIFIFTPEMNASCTITYKLTKFKICANMTHNVTAGYYAPVRMLQCLF